MTSRCPHLHLQSPTVPAKRLRPEPLNCDERTQEVTENKENHQIFQNEPNFLIAENSNYFPLHNSTVFPAPAANGIHASGPRCVNLFVKAFCLIAVLSVCAFAADTSLDSLLKSVEARYNHAKTLEVLFTERYTPLGKASRTESGLLKLRKPGRMRWDYSQPKGKLFISDGKFLWLYNPAENRAERMKLQESEDMRAPLAFLLGKLNFDKDFRNFQARREGDDTRITAEPKTQNLPYSSVEFVVAPDATIREVKATYYDKSTLDFTFHDEKLDPPLEAKLFQFHAPPGTELVNEEGQ